MKITLINLPIREESYLFPSGLGYIASSLLEDGHEVEVLDINGLGLDKESVVREIAKIDTDVVGIGTMVTRYAYLKWLNKTIKESHPKIKIIVGGTVHVAYPYLFKNCNTDIVVFGEGEITIKELAKHFDMGRKLDDIKGIAYKDSKGIHVNEKRPRIQDLDSLPFPAWDLFPMKKYVESIYCSSKGRNKMTIVPTRGCPYQCTFCYRNHGQQVVHRSIDNVMEEIKLVREKYNVTYLILTAENFLLNHKIVTEFCDTLKDTYPEMKWACAGRVNLVNKEILKKMAEGGCDYINFGMESGSQEVLNKMKKGITVEQCKNATKWCKEVGILSMPSFMMGNVGENKETIKETAKLCNEMGILQTVFFLTTPLPETELYAYAKQKGMIKDEEKHLEKLGEFADNLVVNVSEMSDEELLKEREKAIDEIKRYYVMHHPIEFFGKKLNTVITLLRSQGIVKTLRIIAKETEVVK